MEGPLGEVGDVGDVVSTKGRHFPCVFCHETVGNSNISYSGSHVTSSDPRAPLVLPGLLGVEGVKALRSVSPW